MFVLFQSSSQEILLTLYTHTHIPKLICGNVWRVLLKLINTYMVSSNSNNVNNRLLQYNLWSMGRSGSVGLGRLDRYIYTYWDHRPAGTHITWLGWPLKWIWFYMYINWKEVRPMMFFFQTNMPIPLDTIIWITWMFSSTVNMSHHIIHSSLDRHHKWL